MNEILYTESAAVSNVALYRMQASKVTVGDTPAVSDKDFSTPNLKYYFNPAPWAYWGSDNLMPVDMADKIDNCGVLNAALEAITRIAIGKGIRPVIITGISKDGVEEMEFIHDVEIEDWLEMSDDFYNSLTAIFDLLGYGWNHTRLIMSNDQKKIARYRCDDVVNCRLGKKNDIGIIDTTWLAADWSFIFGTEGADKYVKKITCLEENNEYNDLVEILASGSKTKEFSIINRRTIKNGKNYYPNSGWYSVYDWVDLSIRVPAMKIAMFNNQATIKYIIVINEKYFSRNDPKWGSYGGPVKQDKFREKVAEINQHLMGNTNAYKSIAVSGYADPGGNLIPDITIQVLDDKIVDGKLLPDTAAADKQILFSLMMNPAIMGANTAGDYRGGAGSGSDIREAYLVQIMLREAERRMNSKIFNLVKRFNGWSAKYTGQNLQFRYPSLILTTLDTGGSTASTVAAPAPPADPNKPVSK